MEHPAPVLSPLHSPPLHLTHPLHSLVHRQEGGDAAPEPLQPTAPRAAPLCRRRSTTNPWLCHHLSSPIFFPSASPCSTATARSQIAPFRPQERYQEPPSTFWTRGGHPARRRRTTLPRDLQLSPRAPTTLRHRFQPSPPSTSTPR